MRNEETITNLFSKRLTSFIEKQRNRMCAMRFGILKTKAEAPNSFEKKSINAVFKMWSLI